jgi:hypothetical protein
VAGVIAGQAPSEVVGLIASLIRCDVVTSISLPSDRARLRERGRFGRFNQLRHGDLVGPIMDEIRPFGEVSDEPEQSQHHEEEDEQQHALPRAGLDLRAINPIKFHRRVPPPFQTVHEGSHRRLPSSCAGLCPLGRWAAGSQAGKTRPQARHLKRLSVIINISAINYEFITHLCPSE